MQLEAPVVERAKATRAHVESDRRRRHVTIERAHRTRRRSRELKLRTSAAREGALEQRWQLWASRIVRGVPTYVPSSWECEPREDERVLLAAARACEEVAVAAHLVLAADPDQANREVLVLAAALGEVAASRMRADHEEAWVAAAGMARLLEQLDEGFGTPGGVPDHAVLVVACRTTLRTLRHTLARFHAEVEP
jgi:hypothetical protein